MWVSGHGNPLGAMKSSIPSGTTNFDLLQRATRCEEEAARLREVVSTLELELERARVQQEVWKTTDPFYYVTPVSVLPPHVVNEHRTIIESIVEHAILYRESFKLLQPTSAGAGVVKSNTVDGGTPSTMIENQRTSRALRQLQQENEILRSTIARLHHEAASRF